MLFGDLSIDNLLPFAIALGFAAGLNAYLAILVVGLLGHFGAAHGVHLPQGLELLTHTWVIAVSGALYALEFFADKIPYFDVAWNLLHTAVRLPLAALLSFRAGSGLGPGEQALLVAAGTLFAAVAHSSKVASRVGAAASPEPVSNIALSGLSDGVTGGLVWAATTHPRIAAVAAMALTLSIAFLVHHVLLGLRRSIEVVRNRFTFLPR